MTNKENTNLLKLWLSDASYSAAIALSTGPMLSAFFLHNGMTEELIGSYLSITQIVNLAISLLFAGTVSNTRDTRKPLFILTAISGILTIIHIFFCIYTPDNRYFYPVILLLGSLISVITALRTIYTYKLPCDVINLNHYSIYAGYQGLFIGVAGIGIGILLPTFYERFSFLVVTACAFIAAGIFLILSAMFTLWLKPIHDADITHKETKMNGKVNLVISFLDLWRNPDFRILLIPNILRGFGSGLISMFSVLVISLGIFNEGTVSLLNISVYIGTLISCFMYVYLVKKIGVPLTCLLGGIIFSLICIAAFGTSWSCLIIYSLSYIGYNIVCCAIPDLIYRNVSKEVISIFHTWRLSLTQLGTAIATSLYGLLINNVSVILIFIIGTAAYILCALGYYLHYKIPKSG